MTCLPSLRAVDQEFIQASPRHRSVGWDHIVDVNQITVFPLVVPVQVGGGRQNPSVPLEIYYDDVSSWTVPLNLRQDGTVRANKRINDVDVDLNVTFTTRPPRITRIRDNPTEEIGRVLDRRDEHLKIERPANRDADNPHFASLTAWLQNASYRGCPHIIHHAEAPNGSNVSVDFEEQVNGVSTYLPLERRTILYVKDNHRFAVFCKLGLPGSPGNYFFECIKQWDLNDHQHNTILDKQVFYDGTNIYDKVTTPPWLADWTHNGLNPANREWLMLSTLHWETPRGTCAINSHSGNQLIPRNQRYVINSRFHPHGTPVLERKAAVWSDGRSPNCFLAQCCRQGWNSFSQPAIAYEVETFTNTEIAWTFDQGVNVVGDMNGNNVWHEGLYTAEDANHRDQVWRRRYSAHGEQVYRLIASPTGFFGHFQKPARMEGNDFLKHVSYFPLVEIVSCPSIPQSTLEAYLTRMVEVKYLYIKEGYLSSLTGFIRTVMPILVNLRSLSVNVSHCFCSTADSSIRDMGTVLASLPNLHTLKFVLPKIESYTSVALDNGISAGSTVGGVVAPVVAGLAAASAAPVVAGSTTALKVVKGVQFAGNLVKLGVPVSKAAEVGAIVAGAGKTTAAVVGATTATVAKNPEGVKNIGLSLGKNLLWGIQSLGRGAGCLVGGAAGTLVGLGTDTVRWMASESYDEHTSFAYALGKSQTLQNITLYGVSNSHDKKNISFYISVGRFSINQGRNPQLPEIAVHFE